ncbi:hypothetical protein [Solimonas flava]|uniref:hypothetical protein n=1 Tax=Solimonas flava TaxID=415849 RepID=UPI00041D6EEA|nr:hypothetical protein [Solimonas flava]
MPALRLALFALLSLLLTFSGVASASAGTCPAHRAAAAAPAAAAHADHGMAAEMAMPASVAAHAAPAGHEHHAASHAHGAPAAHAHAHACAKTCVCAQACTGGAVTVASAGFAGTTLPGHAERPRAHLAPAPRSAQPFAPLRPPRAA